MIQLYKYRGWLWIALLGILICVGAILYSRQLMNGLITTGMNNSVSWGFYIITFAFLVGLSAGGLIVSSLAYIMHQNNLKKMACVGVICAVACIIGAALMVLIDLGNPINLYKIIIGGNVSSPIVWDFIIIPIYLVLGLVELWILFGKRWRSVPDSQHQHVLMIASWTGLPVALLVHSITAWIFGLQMGCPFWNTALMAPIFISSAVVSGTALLLVVAWANQQFAIGLACFDELNRGFLAKFLAGFIAIDAFFLFCDFFTSLYGNGRAASIANQVIVGPLAPLFIVELVFGVALPLIVLINKKLRAKSGLIAFVSVLAMFGVYAKRINIILPNFLSMNVTDNPGISTGRYIESSANSMAAESPFTMVGIYVPTLSEVMITIGLLALVALIITIGLKRIASINHEELEKQANKDLDFTKEIPLSQQRR